MSLCIVYFVDRLPKLFLNDAEQEMLASLILLDPKWLISVMKKVMELDKSDPGDIQGVSIRNLEKTGRADVELLKACWADCFNDNISFEQLCLILKAYGLIYPMEVPACSGVARSATDPAVPSGSTSKEESTPSKVAGPESELLLRSKSDDSATVSVGPPMDYLIPCKLPLADKANKDDSGATTRSKAVELYFDFLGFLPDEVFQRLICLMLAKAQVKRAQTKVIKTPKFTRTRCQFYFDECLWEIEHQTPHSVLKVSVL